MTGGSNPTRHRSGGINGGSEDTLRPMVKRYYMWCLSSVVTILAATLVASAAVVLCAVPAVSSASQLKCPADWVVTVRTETLKGYLDFPGSAMKHVVRAKVTCAGAFDESGSGTYLKEYYYRGSDIVGSRTQKALTISPHTRVEIDLVHKDEQPEPDEVKAGTNAAIRLWLQLRKNHNLLTALTVPRSSLRSVTEELQRLRFEPIDAPTDGAIEVTTTLSVYCAESGDQQIFIYR